MRSDEYKVGSRLQVARHVDGIGGRLERNCPLCTIMEQWMSCGHASYWGQLVWLPRESKLEFRRHSMTVRANNWEFQFSEVFKAAKHNGQSIRRNEWQSLCESLSRR